MEVTYLAGPAISQYGVPATKSPEKGSKFLNRLLHVLLSIRRPQTPTIKRSPLSLFILHFLSHLFVKTRDQCSSLHSLLSLSNPKPKHLNEKRKKKRNNQKLTPPFSKNELDPGSLLSTSYRIARQSRRPISIYCTSLYNNKPPPPSHSLPEKFAIYTCRYIHQDRSKQATKQASKEAIHF